MAQTERETERAGGRKRRPEWLKVPLSRGPRYKELKSKLADLELNTVCEEAKCPNIGECWGHGTATFMILGDTCTRSCRFCAVKSGWPSELDLREPERVAEAVEHMDLSHVVVTSVARDDLDDGGASIFADTIRAVRERKPETGVEVLIPDFGGREQALAKVLAARPDILNHNMETCRRLTPEVRSRATYDRSLKTLRRAKEMIREAGDSGMTKSGMMLGLGEEKEEIVATLEDLRSVDCDIVTIGQYLRPTYQTRHLPIERFVPPEEFDELKQIGLELGFRHVESGPLVRSSYHAHEQSNAAAGGASHT